MVILEPELNKRLIERLRNNTLHKLGYDACKTMHPKIERMLDEALLVAEKAARPKGVYRILPVLGTSRDGVQTQAGTVRSAMFARLVDMCRGDRLIVFMIATLGEELGNTCRADDPVSRQLIFNTVGSELVELVADMVEADWRGQMETQGLQCSYRSSPGYCDWALQGQGIIFGSLDAGLIGVRLTSHFVMIPEKSISAVAVIAKDVPIPAPCVFCAKKDCPWRRLPLEKDRKLVS